MGKGVVGGVFMIIRQGGYNEYFKAVTNVFDVRSLGE